jgi:Spy/CpxP family protein refolding chaperone
MDSCYSFWRPAYAAELSCFGPRVYRSRSYHWGAGGPLGVRRPLRYLSYHLDLDEGQRRRVAQVLNRLKLEREQAHVDEKRSVAAIADLVDAGTPELEQVKAAIAARITNAERLQTEVARSVQELCDILDPDQRQAFADLLRSGAISI